MRGVNNAYGVFWGGHKLQLALFARSEERADERSNVGVSPGADRWPTRRCVNIARIFNSPGRRFAGPPSLRFA